MFLNNIPGTFFCKVLERKKSMIGSVSAFRLEIKSTAV